MDTDRPLADIRDQVLSANVYIGAAPVVRALEMGANVIIAGRVTDTAVTLAPMIHEFGWAANDWDRLAHGIVAGHIIECGTQCTGGNFSRWWEVPDLWNAGYPIIEARPDGTFTVTKHEGTGGMVTVDTISEQLLYEMGDPAGYLTPDVTADFTSIRLHQALRLMLHEGLGAAEAAYRVGYASASQFSREFKRLFGATPRQEVARLGAEAVS